MASHGTPSSTADDTAKQKNDPLPLPPATLPPSRRKRVSFWLAVFGIMFLSYLLGAAVMFFELPSSDFLSKGFVGARAWNERRQAPSPIPVQQTPLFILGNIDKPGQAFDGFTLYTCASMTISGTQAFLVDMKGKVVHRWALPFSRVWPNPPHVRGRVNDSLVCFFDCHLYPNGDLLVVFHGQENWVNGYGLAKLDKDSNVLWKYAANIHHDVDVGEDGTIYAIAHEVVSAMPKGLGFVPTPCLVDHLVLLSADGKELRKPISILEAFHNSPYAPLLASLGLETKRDLPPGLNVPRYLDDTRKQDPLHLNCVRVLNHRLAAKFPQFKAGQVLICLRNLDTIAVLDTERDVAVWAARGPWRAQHDAQFLDNGRLLIFDNLGSPRGSRVLEYDPRTQAFSWTYPGADKPAFFSSERGMCQRLPNGNTLIANSVDGEILEVTAERELAWTCFTSRFITSARRFSAEQVPFLKKGTRPRP